MKSIDLQVNWIYLLNKEPLLVLLVKNEYNKIDDFKFKQKITKFKNKK